jgi:hypothetical protein
MIRKPIELEARNKDLEDLKELNPELPKGIKVKDPMKDMFGVEEEEEEDPKDKKARSLSDFIEVIIKIGR